MVTVFVVGTVRVGSGGAYVLIDADFDVVVCKHLAPNDELVADLSVNVETKILFAMVYSCTTLCLARFSCSQVISCNIHLATAIARSDT